MTTLAFRSIPQRGSRCTGQVRFFAAIIATLVGLAQLAVLLHFVLIRHEYCAEHRHLVHSAEYERARAGAIPVRTNAQARNGVELLDRHNHCDAPVGIGKSAYLICGAGVALHPAQAVRAPCVVDRSRSLLRVATLSFAPKLSPPSA